jgi:hypothetical protein
VRDPRREPCTICTACAPDAVLTVRTSATTPVELIYRWRTESHLSVTAGESSAPQLALRKRRSPARTVRKVLQLDQLDIESTRRVRITRKIGLDHN